MDVKTTFLNKDLDEEIYMEQPEGFIVKGQEHKVCKLMKSLYDLKQAPKQWHEKFDQVILDYNFKINNMINIYIIRKVMIIMSYCVYMWMIFLSLVLT